MRSSLAILCMAVFGLSLIACNDAAKPVRIEKVTNNQSGPSANVDSDGHEDTAERIDLAEAKAAFDKGDAVFVDTRNAEYFDKEHIKGSINIPAADLDKVLNKIPKGKKIIAYCS